MQVCPYFCPTCSVSILRTTIARKSRRSSFFLYAKRHGARLVSGIMKFWLPSKRYSFSINDYHCFNLVTFSTQWRDLVDSLLRNLKFSWIVWCWGERKSVQILCLFRFINNIYRLNVLMILGSLQGPLSFGKITSVKKRESCTCLYSPMLSDNSRELSCPV